MCKVQSSQVPVGWVKGKINGSLLGDWSSFCYSLCLSFWSALGFTLGGRHRHSGQRSSCSAVHFSSRGRARWVGRRRWRLRRRRQSSKGVSFYFPCVFWVEKILLFFRGIVLGFAIPLGMLVAKWVPTPCYNDAYSVGTPEWAFWVKGWQKYHKTTFSPLLGRFFLVSKRTIYFFWWFFYGFLILVGPGILGLALGFLLLVSCLLSLLMLVAG